MNSPEQRSAVTVTRIPDDPNDARDLEREDPDGRDHFLTENGPGGTGCPASTGSPISFPTSPSSPPTNPPPIPPALMTPEQIDEYLRGQWKAALERWYGKEKAEKILARRLCPFCDKKLRPFRDAKTQAQGSRCLGCGREF